MVTLSWLHIVGLLAAVVVYRYWVASQNARQIAVKAAFAHCKERDVQLLDATVSVHRVWVKRDARRYWRFWRSYTFEFSPTGNERLRGQVVLLGKTTESIVLEPYVH